MDWFFEILTYEFNQRALLAALMIGFLNGFFGGYIVLKKASLYAGALNHTLFPGIALGALIAGLNPVSAFIGATITALIVGLFSQVVSQYSRIDENTSLAILYPFFFALGLFVLYHLSLSISIEDYLFGDILGISNFDLWFIFGVGLVVLSFLILFQRTFLIILFSKETAATTGISVRSFEFIMAILLVLTMITTLQAVGTILTLGLLVTPASIMYLLFDSTSKITWGGGILGAFVAASSVFLSNILNVQTGTLIILLLGALFILTFILSPKYGIIFHFFLKGDQKH